jgi:hypothetical protein
MGASGGLMTASGAYRASWCFWRPTGGLLALSGVLLAYSGCLLGASGGLLAVLGGLQGASGQHAMPTTVYTYALRPAELPKKQETMSSSHAHAH